jgi:MATE family multidrug resistance protein
MLQPATAPHHAPSIWTEARATAWLAMPLALANVLQMAVYAIDVMFVARLGADALAASSLAISLLGMLLWSFSAMGGPVAALVAAAQGAADGAPADRTLRRTVGAGLWVAVGLGLLTMAICTQGEAILRATGQNPTVAHNAGAFLRIICWTAVPTVAANVLRSVVSALGRPVFATLITALAIGVNACGNYALVFGHWGAPALGLHGSALSSVATGCASLAAYLAVLTFDRRLSRMRLLAGLLRVDSARLAQLLRMGLPVAFTVLAEAGLFGAAAFLMGRIGIAELAAHTMALQLAAFTFQLPMGIGQAATIRVGYHFGAGNARGVGQAGWSALAIGLGVASCSALAMLVIPRLMLSPYIDVEAPAQAGLVALAVRYLAVAAAFQLADSTQAILAGALRGLQDTSRPMLFAMVGYWPLGFVIAVGLGLFTPLRGIGIWIGLATGLTAVGALLFWRWTRRESLGLTSEA